ncbi:MAG: PQ-loop repeat-containing protein, partial [Actinobacteria bacterium]|nr:PQ-loop repeat-containing protein [Actinomycetota bacterium]
MTLQNVLGIVASIMSMLFIWPQVILVYRSNTVEGLSPIGALQGICGSTLWSVYGLSQGDVAVGGSNFLIVVAIALPARAKVKHGTLPASRLYATVFAVTAFAFICVSVS